MMPQDTSSPDSGGLLLGRQVAQPQKYAPELLQAVPRPEPVLDLEGKIRGVDMWCCYELMLHLQGSKFPAVQILSLEVSRETSLIIESKSLKLYLNSLSKKTWQSMKEVEQALQADIAAATQNKEGEITIVWNPQRYAYEPERAVSNLLMTRCPITGQPDFADLVVAGFAAEKPAITQEQVDEIALSFHNRQMFQEEVADRVYAQVASLSYEGYLNDLMVGCLYTRRGGIEINAWRWGEGTDNTRPPKNYKSPRQ